MRAISARVCATILLFVIAILPNDRARAQPLLDDVHRDWHDASVAQAHADWGTAIKIFDKVIREVQPLPLPIREWFRGVSGIGTAQSAARIPDEITARNGIVYGFAHQFMNGAILKQDSMLMALVGSDWLDSVSAYWQRINDENRPTWLPQEPIVFRPSDRKPGERFALILALHGGNGNYQNYASYWRSVADAARAVIVVPAGIIRNSETANSWEYDMAAVDPFIQQLRVAYIDSTIDPTQIYLAGYSQGAQVSIVLALAHPDLFRGAMAYSGFVAMTIPQQWLEQAKAHGTRIYAHSGEFDAPQFLSQIHAVATQCQSAGVPFQLDIVPGLSHEMPIDLAAQFPTAWRFVRSSTP